MALRKKAIEVEVTQSAIRVRHGGRTLTIPATAPDIDSDGEADLVVQLDEIEHWDAPDDDTLIDIHELQKILEAVETEMVRRGLDIDFE